MRIINSQDFKIDMPKLKKGVENKRKKSLFKRILLSIFLILFVCTLYSLFTPHSENVLVIGTRKVLASVGVFTEEVKSVEIESDGYDKQEGGAWHIDKSADWIDLSKAQIKFNLDTIVKSDDYLKDVVFVLDISGSMDGDKLERVKSDTKELINFLLSNNQNKVALITFESTSTVLSEFTNDKEKLIELVDGLQDTGCTNYNIALSNVDKVLEGYTSETNRDLVILFLTDGYPNEDTPNQIATYKVLKDKYQYMTLNGVQYEMGLDIIKEIKDISDNQYIADMDSLNNVLFEASINPEFYESFEIVDYIDENHWYVESESDIKVDKGHIKLEEENGVQKVIWSFEDGELRTGESLSMTIDVKLKEQYIGTKGFYPTNEKETINYKLKDKEEKDISTKTPVLKAGYKVIYDGNLPSECGEFDIIEENHFAFETVAKKQDKLVCNGYIFKGWEFSDSDIIEVNDDVFIMPSKDVVIRGIWTKPVIAKSMEGEVRKKFTLYNQIQNDFNNNSEHIKKYTGATDTFIGDKDVYYYYGEVANNNVIFANYCWKIVRTTDTGGVKLLYNGLPNEAGACDNSGFDSQLTSLQMNNNEKGFSPINNPDSFLASAGYMYNNIYSMKRFSGSSKKYKFANSFSYDSETGMYTLIDTDLSPIKSDIDIGTSYSELAYNHYSCLNDSGVCQTLVYFYFVGSSSNIFYIELSNGKSAFDAIKEMLYDDDLNKKDSTVKTAIDYWYEHNMTDYTKYLEDTFWCNDRSTYNLTDSGWNPNGGDLNTELAFRSFENYENLTCPNKIDRFTVDSANGNGALKYPVGMLTEQEVYLSSVAISSKYSYWTLSPYYFPGDHMLFVHELGNGQLTHYLSWVGRGVRPAVSLSSSVGFDYGDGTIDNPYIIES